MYPQDEQPPQNNNAMGPPPTPFVVNQPNNDKKPDEPKTKRSLPSWVPWAVGGAVVLLLFVVGVILVATSTKKEEPKNEVPTTQTATPEEEESVASGCKPKERRYQNKDLDMRFCYPTAWGDVKVADGKFDPSDNGTRLLITFADKKPVQLGLVSDDWSTDSDQLATCTTPGVQAFPGTSSFSAKWVTEGSGQNIMGAVRGLEVVPDEYLLQERTDVTATKGVCLEGYKAFNGEVYRNAMATYYAAFTDKAKTPAVHINDPKVLIPVEDRTDLTNFVKSIENY